MVASNKDTLSISTITSKINVIRNHHEAVKMESQEQTDKDEKDGNNRPSIEK